MLRRRNRASVWPSIFLRKPGMFDKVNWRHPISRSLVGAYLYQEQGLYRNLVLNNLPPFTAVGAAVLPGDGTREGSTAYDTSRGRLSPRLALTGTGRVSVANPMGLGTGTTFTIANLLQPDFTSADASFRGIWYYGTGNVGDEPRIWLRRQASSAAFFVDSPGQALGQATFSWSQNDIFWATYTISGNTSQQWYQDGVALSMSSSGGNPAGPSGWVFNIGDRHSGASTPWLGGIYATFIWRRVILADELREFLRKPFEMFEPEGSRETFLFIPPPPDLGEPVGILQTCGHPLFTKCGSWLTN